MDIILNGEPKTLPSQCTAQQLVEILGMIEGRIAVEINQEIVPRSTFGSHVLQSGDRVEIVHAVGGGAV